jgi:catechol 2,3-dioxygenase-like lactoylglutathione lyase family enzyme
VVPAVTLAHLALVVRDQARSRSFYESYFGFDAGPSNVLDNGVLFIRNADGFELALAPRDEPVSMPPFVHFGFRLNNGDEVRALKEHLDSDGYETLDEENSSDHVSFKCKDPDGYLIEAYWSTL